MSYSIAKLSDYYNRKLTIFNHYGIITSMRTINPLLKYIRKDIPGIFNEVDILKKHKSRFFYALNGEKILPPLEILIHPSGRCNLRCSWCIGGWILEEKEKTKGIGVLPSLLSDPANMEKVIRGILDYTKDGFRVENVSFSGITGDPFLAKEAFIRAVNLLSENNVRIGVYSNTVLLDDELINTLLKMNYINVSLDAATPETFVMLKYGGNSGGVKIFNNLIENITKLAQLRNNSKDSKLDINASFVLYPENYKEIYDAAKLLKRIGIRIMRMKQDISGKMLLSKKQMTKAKELIKKVKNLEDDKFKFVTIHRLKTSSDMRRQFDECVISDLVTTIGSDGNVYPCNYQACLGNPVYGNAIKNSFADIWEGKTKMKIRRQLPKTCPTVCDPFNNRANRLFQGIKESQEKYGTKETEKFIQEIINLY
ncbi:MAG: radical SAM protein [bacterium]|nr:radical SAM protein [bacterium]